MKYTEAKEKLAELLDEAKARLGELGLKLECELELMENSITETETEAIMLLASVALSAEGFGEDDVYYISAEARIEGDEVNDDAFAKAVSAFRSRVDEVFLRLNTADDRAATLLEMGKEIDDELQRIYDEESAKNERLMKRDLMTAIIGSAIVIVGVIAACIIGALI